MARFCSLFAVLVLASGMANAGERPHGCDLLASYEYDEQAIAPGVADGQVDAARALAACRVALDSHPGHPRYQFLYGRALMLSGRGGEGAAYLTKALEANYAAAPLYLAQRGAEDPTFKQEYVAHLYHAADRLGSSWAFTLVGWRMVAFGDTEASIMRGYQLLEVAAGKGNIEAKATLGAHYFFHPRFAVDLHMRHTGKSLLAEAAAAGSTRGVALLNLVHLEEDAYGLITLERVGDGQAMIDTITRAVEDRRRDVLIWAHHVVTNRDYESDTIRRLLNALCGSRSYTTFVQAIGDPRCSA